MFLTRVGHALWRGILAAALAAPLLSVLTRTDVPAGAKATFALLALLTLVRPAWGLLAAACLVPSGMALHMFTGALSSTALTECTVLVFAAAATVSRPVDSASRSWLTWPALCLGAAVVTSAVVELSQMAAVTPTRAFWHDMVEHVRHSYWTDDAGNWAPLHEGMRWVSVLTLAVTIERVGRRAEAWARWATWAWLSAAAAATSFTVMRIVSVVMSRETSAAESISWMLANVRLSALHADPNAAGSLFVMLMVGAWVVGRGRAWWLLPLALPLFVIGATFAQSRAAVGAMLLVVTAHLIVRRVQRGLSVVVVAIVASVLVVGASAWMLTSRAHIAAAEAMQFRIDVAKVGTRIVWHYPWFGVGVGDYARTSRRFIADAGGAIVGWAPTGENAHNNFLQVAGELGIPAGVAFVFLVGPVVCRLWRRDGTSSPEYEGVALGVAVFLASACFGHPLLIAEVSAMFFFGLGLTAALAGPSPSWADRARPIALGGLAAYVAAVVLRGRW